MKTSDPFVASMGRTVGVLSVVAMAAACGGGVSIAANAGGFAAAFANCEISSNGGHGVVVPNVGVGVSATGCNLFGNGGNAIVNQTAATVDARGNWWGDASGPLGPNGDGVAGAVDAGDPRAASVVLGY